MRIAFIRYPEELYTSGRVLRGGSEIANQHIIDYLKQSSCEIYEYFPQSKDRLELINLPAMGTPLLFQDLLKRVDEINSCDVVVTTNWFGLVMPEITKPVVTIFHSNAALMKTVISKGADEKEVFNKWLDKAKKYGLADYSKQDLHEEMISLGEKYALDHSDAVIAVSRFLKDSLVSCYGAKADKIYDIPNSLPTAWDTEIVDTIDGHAANLACVTRLPDDFNGFLVKGEDRIFEIISRLNQIPRTLLVSSKPGIFQEFVDAELPGVDFIENADRDKVRAEMIKANITLHASRCESYGLNVVESMVMGCVPVVFPTGIAEEIVESGRTGFLVNSIEEAVNAIKMLNNDHTLLKTIGRQARESVISKLSIESIGEQYRRVLNQVVDNS